VNCTYCKKCRNVGNIQKDITVKPQVGFQQKFAMSNVDVIFGVGQVGSGKSYALTLAMAEPLMTDSDFRALISRRLLGSLKSGGGFVDTFQDIFGNYVSVKQADSPRATFTSGAYCDLTYIDDSNLDKMRERAKGWQYDVIAIDELTEMSWEAFSYLQTRNRGRSKSFTGKFFATLNPKRSHWSRSFLDWYILPDGSVNPEREGCVRYFYVNGSTVKDVVWGDNKEEVYRKCKIDIDRKLKKIGGNFSYENMIKSFVFYQGRLSENRITTDNNPDYIGSVAVSGGRMAQALLEANFNVDPDDDDKVPIPNDKAVECFVNDPALNGDKWITVDLADYGSDNLVAMAFNGFHVIKMLVCNHTTPRDNAYKVKAFANQCDIADDHIIFDGTSGRYFKDYIPDSIAFLSSFKPMGMYALQAVRLKDECAMRLVKMINAGQFTFDESVAQMIYTHANIHYNVTVQNEFLEECSVIRFIEMPNGKKRLMGKKQMNQNLGKGRSMDVLDPCIMRMYPCLSLAYGDELKAGFYESELDANNEDDYVKQSIYDETLWA
jgi:hypothetical protein